MKLLKFVFTMSLLLIAFCLVGQTNVDSLLNETFPIEGSPNAEKFITWYNALLAGLIMAWGYIAKAFKLNTKVPRFVLVVIAGGIVIGGGFVFFGFTDFLSVAITLLGTMGIYDLIKGVAGKLPSAPNEPGTNPKV